MREREKESNIFLEMNNFLICDVGIRFQILLPVTMVTLSKARERDREREREREGKRETQFFQR